MGIENRDNGNRWPFDYPLWSPPEYVVGKDHGSWGKLIARKHYDWYLGYMPKRVGIVENYLGRRINSEDEYLKAASDVYGLIVQDATSYKSKFDHPDRVNQALAPSASGNALLADLGLALAVGLGGQMQNQPCWRLSRTSGRKLNANMPVMVPYLDSPEFKEVNPARLCTACGWDALREGRAEPLESAWGVLYSSFTR